MSNLLATMNAEREALVKRLAEHKPDPNLATRIAALRAELAKLQADASGAGLKAEIAAIDKAIAAIESPGKVTKPMSETGRAAIKQGLQKYHENRKKAVQAPAAPPTAPVPASGERNVAQRK
jgi:hypothetical protein